MKGYLAQLIASGQNAEERLLALVVFQRPVRVKVLESALAGDPRCRFEIEIPEEHR